MSFGRPSKDQQLTNLALQQTLTGCERTLLQTRNLTACQANITEADIAGAVIDSQCATFPQGVCTPSISGFSPIEVKDELIITAGLTIPSGAATNYVLTSNATGNAMWAAPTGGGGGTLQTSTVTVNPAYPSTAISNVLVQKIGRVATLQLFWTDPADVIAQDTPIATIDDPTFWPANETQMVGHRFTPLGASIQEIFFYLTVSGELNAKSVITTIGASDELRFICQSYFTV